MADEERTSVIIKEPRLVELQKVWLHDVDSLLKKTVVFQFLLQFGVLLMGRNWVIFIETFELRTLVPGAIIYIGAFVLWALQIRKKRRKMIAPSKGVQEIDELIAELESQRTSSQTKLERLNKRMRKMGAELKKLQKEKRSPSPRT